MKPEERREMWQGRIDACQASGLSIREWCKRNEINESAMYHWKKRLVGKRSAASEATDWVRLTVGEEVVASLGGIVVRVGSAIIEVQPGFNRGLLQDVVRTLSGSC